MAEAQDMDVLSCFETGIIGIDECEVGTHAAAKIGLVGP